MTHRRIRVATVITRMTAGAGGVALRGALALDPDRYAVVIVTGGTGFNGERMDRTQEVLSGVDAVKDAPEGDLLAAAYEAGLGAVRIPSLVPEISLRKDAAALRILTGVLREGRFDVVHTNSAKGGALGRVAASRAHVERIVHTYHGFPFHEFQSPWRRGLYVGIERWLGRRTDVCLAVGSGVAAEAIRRGLVSPDRVRTIAPAVDPVCYPAGTAARGMARRRLGLPAGVRLVGTVGRVDYQKAPEQWIDALAEVDGDDVWGLWIGDGPLRGRLLARARKRGLADRFRLLGHREDVSELLPALDVFALASRYEGLPCALIEAIGAGVPVVATAVNAVPDVVVPGETGLLVPAQAPRVLGQAIGYLLNEPVEARRMAAAAKARVGEWYTPHTLGTVLDHVYGGRMLWS
ncbi:MAG: glycosyltransferase family 4 protein [Actinobacteria bacterium]|nr:MAG: glycosyltransferase family 4 protein [Actinomycetota bacterium]